MKDAGRRSDLEAGMAKLFTPRPARRSSRTRSASTAVTAYSKEYEIERLYRDAPLLLISEGLRRSSAWSSARSCCSATRSEQRLLRAARSREQRPGNAASHRGLRPHRRHADGGAGRQGRLDRLALPAAVRLARLLRRAARRPVAQPLADRAGRCRSATSSVATATARSCSRRTSTADGAPRHRLDADPRRGARRGAHRALHRGARHRARGADPALRLRPRRPVGTPHRTTGDRVPSGRTRST